MDSALYEGKRIFIPLNYSIPLLLSTKSILENENFNIENCKNFLSFRKETERWREHKSSGRRLFRMDITATNSIIWAGYDLADFNTKKLNIESEEIEDYFKWCKEVKEEDKADYFFGALEGAASLRDGEILNDFPKDCPEFTEEQQEEYMGYTKEVNKACFLPKWRDKLMEAMQPYLNGEMSYEECIKQAKEQVELYLSE